MSNRDEAYRRWWKNHRKNITPSMLTVAGVATRQAWDAAWDYRDSNGPSEEDARRMPLRGDLWIKHVAREVKIQRRIIHWPQPVAHIPKITFDEKRGFGRWIQKTIRLTAWVAWAQTASLETRGRVA